MFMISLYRAPAFYTTYNPTVLGNDKRHPLFVMLIDDVEERLWLKQVLLPG